MRRTDGFGKAQLPKGLPDHDLGRQPGQRDADGLAYEGHGAGCPRIDLEDVQDAVLYGILNVHEPDDPEFSGNPPGLLLDLPKQLRREGNGRERTGAVPGVDSGLLDVLHDARHHRVRTVADGVHVHFDGVLQKLVDEDRMARGDMDRGFHEAPQGLRVVDDLHGPAAQDVRRAHDDRVADPLCGPDGVGHIHGRVVVGLPQVQPVNDLLKALPVLRPVDGVGRCAEDRRPGGLQAPGQIERGLSAELDDHAHRLLRVQDVQDVLQRHRLEKELVRRVVVGAHRLRVRVDHDALVALLAERKRGVHAAVVELDALADPVGAAAQDDDLRPVRGARLVLPFVGRIIVGRVGLELRGAGVHQLVNRLDSPFEAPPADVPFPGFPELAQAAVGEAPPLRLPQQLVRGG